MKAKGMRFLRKLPFHPLLLAAFPALSLLATNIREVDPLVAVRPLLLAILATGVLVAALRVVMQDWRRAAILVSCLVVLFFSYGHLYQVVKNTAVLGVNIGRHRYLLPLMFVALVGASWFSWRALRNLGLATQVLNVAGLVLTVVPTFQAAAFLMRSSASLQKTAQAASEAPELIPAAPANLPDIYYIVLDTYTRADALERDFDFDNSQFISQLREMGFYVADCRRANYSYTQGAITAALNLDYVGNLGARLEALGLETQDIWALLKRSYVRTQLEALGYRTVAFETGYEWSRLRDADIYLALDKNPITVQRMEPFEALLLESTAVLPFIHRHIQIEQRRNRQLMQSVEAGTFPYEGYAERQLFILDQLPRIAWLNEPTFAFVHLLIPHIPYVFDPRGRIWTDSGFYSGERAGPVDEWHLRVGYVSEIQFINSRLIPILQQILEASDVPPIIVIHGDHGLRDENRLQIFNAYYLPGDGSGLLYPTISPVNSFRVIFNEYFGTSFELLPDLSYMEGDPNPRPETSGECLAYWPDATLKDVDNESGGASE
jgi:hypothetical protein